MLFFTVCLSQWSKFLKNQTRINKTVNITKADYDVLAVSKFCDLWCCLDLEENRLAGITEHSDETARPPRDRLETASPVRVSSHFTGGVASVSTGEFFTICLINTGEFFTCSLKQNIWTQQLQQATKTIGCNYTWCDLSCSASKISSARYLLTGGWTESFR